MKSLLRAIIIITVFSSPALALTPSCIEGVDRVKQHGFMSGLPTKAMIDQMLEMNPKRPENWVWSARLKLQSGDCRGGLAELNKAIDLGGSVEAYAQRGAVRLDAKEFDGASQDAKKALELEPGDEDAMKVLQSAERRTSR